MRWWEDYKRGRDAREAEERAFLVAAHEEGRRLIWESVMRPIGCSELSHDFYVRGWNQHKEESVQPTQEQLLKVYEAAKEVVEQWKAMGHNAQSLTQRNNELVAAVRAAERPRWTSGSYQLTAGLFYDGKPMLYAERTEAFSAVLLDRISALLNADDATGLK
jgi:hypothetical protein